MDTFIRSTVLYWMVLIALRLIGRRAISLTTPFELIIIFLLGGLAVQAIVVDDHSLVNALIGICSITVNHLTTSWAKLKWPSFRRLIDDTPVIVVRQGKVDTDRLRALRMDEQDLMMAARGMQITSIDQIDYAVVERDGSFTLFRREEKKE
jgi:uncharacterized membrane protein YcaP (DUF421 family)